MLMANRVHYTSKLASPTYFAAHVSGMSWHLWPKKLDTKVSVGLHIQAESV